MWLVALTEKPFCRIPFRRVTMRADAGSLELDALFFLSAETVDSLWEEDEVVLHTRDAADLWTRLVVSESQAGHFRFSSSRSSSIRCRRNVNLLERNVRLHIPFLQVFFPSPSKGGWGILQDHSYCTGLAKTSLVHRSAASLVCKTTSSSSQNNDKKSLLLKSLPPEIVKVRVILDL
jgi:hypothetical protein